MKTILCVYDKKAGCFIGAPLFVQSKGVGLRSFTDECNRSEKGNQLYEHPEDFVLYHLGDFDELNGKFVCDKDAPMQLATGFDVKIRE